VRSHREVTCEDGVRTTARSGYSIDASVQPLDRDLRTALGQAAAEQVHFGASFQLTLEALKKADRYDGAIHEEESWEYIFAFRLFQSRTHC
jgi:hypothetical protein